jgi:hypothetical protein
MKVDLHASACTSHSRARAANRQARLLLCLLATTAVSAGAPAALASESWAIDMINEQLAERAAEGKSRSKPARAAERETDFDDDDESRPQRRSTRAHNKPRAAGHAVRLASLGRDPASAPVSLTKDPAARQTPKAGKPGEMLASLGREFAKPLEPSRQQNTAQPPGPARNKLGPMVASLGRDFAVPLPSALPPLGGDRVHWTASASCLASPLRTVIALVASNFGAVKVNSTCRSRRHNARVGGARHSYHLSGNAVDFRVTGRAREVYAFLRSTRAVGGLKHYGGGLFHIDTGPRRTW